MTSDDNTRITENDSEYVPKGSRSGVALCLSGGGYRAALYQSGAVRRLNELGILGQLQAVSSVSGGSIFAAFLSTRLNKMNAGRFADYEADIAAPFRQFTKKNIRTTPALRRLLPWEWLNGGAQSEGLESQYDTHLCPGKKLKDLPVEPRFHFCSTDLAFGVNWTFTRDKVGDYQAGYMNPAASGEIPLARAVAASSCFPPVFKPMPMKLETENLSILGKTPAGPQRDSCIRALALTDGGVYDNMGLEPVWKSCQTLLVCDGGKPFRFTTDSDGAHQLLRINDIMGDQAEAVRKRWLIASYVKEVYGGAYWGIASDVGKYDIPSAIGYSAKLADEVISTIRTDMDPFSDAEAGVLENHGYTLAEVAVKKHAPDLYKDVALVPPNRELWPGSLDIEMKIRQLLVDSAKIHVLGHSGQG